MKTQSPELQNFIENLEGRNEEIRISREPTAEQILKELSNDR